MFKKNTLDSGRHTAKANDTPSTARPIKKHLAEQPPSGINTPPTGHVRSTPIQRIPHDHKERNI